MDESVEGITIIIDFIVTTGNRSDTAPSGCTPSGRYFGSGPGGQQRAKGVWDCARGRGNAEGQD